MGFYLELQNFSTIKIKNDTKVPAPRIRKAEIRQ